MFQQAFKRTTDEVVDRVFIFGIVRLAEANMLSNFNNLFEVAIYEEIGNKLFGFTGEEVEKCISHYVNKGPEY